MSVALVNGRGAAREPTRGRPLRTACRTVAFSISSPRPSGALRRAERRDLGGQLLLPGFIDSQVNGGGGVLFNDAPSVESIRAIGRAHRRFGTTGFCPR